MALVVANPFSVGDRTKIRSTIIIGKSDLTEFSFELNLHSASRMADCPDVRAIDKEPL